MFLCVKLVLQFIYGASAVLQESVFTLRGRLEHALTKNWISAQQEVLDLVGLLTSSRQSELKVE